MPGQVLLMLSLSIKKTLWPALFLFFFLASLPAQAAVEEEKTVRVGWFENSFNITGKNGVRSGFGYEYQQEIAVYAGWNYEYVKGDWTSLMQMLEKGEIDLLSDVSFTAERARNMLYSAQAMGREKYYLYMKNSCTDMKDDNFRRLNGKKVGINAGSVQAAIFRQWAEERGIEVDIVPVKGFPDAQEKIDRGELNGVVAPESSRTQESSLAAMTFIGSSDIYFGISRTRPELKEDLDAAMERIAGADQYFGEDLYRKYMPTHISAMLSRKEKEWLEARGPIRVAYQKNNLALSGHDPDTGELIGALARYIDFAKNCFANGQLEFELVPCVNQWEMLTSLKCGNADTIF
ncbi:MAG: substrate-binding periplasmic protein, partial [Mailhella sp.]